MFVFILSLGLRRPDCGWLSPTFPRRWTTSLEPPAASPLHKSSTFGYVTTIYKAVIIKTGQHIFLR